MVQNWNNETKINTPLANNANDIQLIPCRHAAPNVSTVISGQREGGQFLWTIDVTSRGKLINVLIYDPIIVK
jgi:hypothetical protein